MECCCPCSECIGYIKHKRTLHSKVFKYSRSQEQPRQPGRVVFNIKGSQQPAACSECSTAPGSSFRAVRHCAGCPDRSGAIPADPRVRLGG